MGGRWTFLLIAVEFNFILQTGTESGRCITGFFFTEFISFSLWVSACVQVEVFYIDYGTTSKVNLEQLRHLHLRFAEMPVQAYRGRIDGNCSFFFTEFLPSFFY